MSVKPDLETAPPAPAPVGERLNTHFVGLARLLDRLIQRSGRALNRVLFAGDNTHLAAHARARLSDLHLRVGECIYRMETSRGDTAPIKRQLCALLAEIERVEDVLCRVQAAPTAGNVHDAGDELYALLGGVEGENPRE